MFSVQTFMGDQLEKAISFFPVLFTGEAKSVTFFFVVVLLFLLLYSILLALFSSGKMKLFKKEGGKVSNAGKLVAFSIAVLSLFAIFNYKQGKLFKQMETLLAAWNSTMKITVIGLLIAGIAVLYFHGRKETSWERSTSGNVNKHGLYSEEELDDAINDLAKDQTEQHEAEKDREEAEKIIDDIDEKIKDEVNRSLLRKMKQALMKIEQILHKLEIDKKMQRNHLDAMQKKVRSEKSRIKKLQYSLQLQKMLEGRHYQPAEYKGIIEELQHDLAAFRQQYKGQDEVKLYEQDVQRLEKRLHDMKSHFIPQE